MVARRLWTPPLLVTSSALSNNMGEHCCGGSQKRKGFGVFTHQYEQNVEMSKIKSRKLSEIMEKLSIEDRAIINMEINSILKSSNEVLATNHMLRSRILDLESQVDILNTRIEFVRNSSNIDEAKRLTYFPRESQFTRIND
jgi:hypothetical protein